MEEQSSWKGHAFTFLVFGGILFLCSIFFVLGMLVGRGQGQRSAEAAVVTAAAKSEAGDSIPSQNNKSANASFEGLETGKEKASNPDPTPNPIVSELPDNEPTSPAPKSAPVPPPATASAPPSPAAPAVAPAPVKMLYLQVAALEKEAADKQVDELQKKGFSVIMMHTGDANNLYRVQVGPFSNAVDEDKAKSKLEALGYKPIKK